MNIRIRLAAAVVGAAALLSACGGSPEAAAPATVTVTAEAEAPATVTKTATATVTETVTPTEEPEPTNSSGLTDEESLEIFEITLQEVWDGGEVDTKILCKAWIEDPATALEEGLPDIEGVDQDYIDAESERIATEFFDEQCAEAAEAATSDGYVALGETWIYADGLEITVSKPKEYWPSDTSAGGDGYDVFRKFTVTITNNTNEPYDPFMALVDVSANGYVGDQVFDSAQGLGSAPSTTVRPGKSISWEVGFGLDSTTDIQVEVDPDFINYETAIFVSE